MLSERENQFHEILMPSSDEIFDKFVDIPGINEMQYENVEPLEEVRLIQFYVKH